MEAAHEPSAVVGNSADMADEEAPLPTFPLTTDAREVREVDPPLPPEPSLMTAKPLQSCYVARDAQGRTEADFTTPERGRRARLAAGHPHPPRRRGRRRRAGSPRGGQSARAAPPPGYVARPAGPDHGRQPRRALPDRDREDQPVDRRALEDRLGSGDLFLRADRGERAGNFNPATRGHAGPPLVRSKIREQAADARGWRQPG